MIGRDSERSNTTCWSLVTAAADPSNPDSRGALAALCQAYWLPLYEHVRRRGYGSAQAEDLVQGFFARLIEHNIVQKADASRGRFRTFLLTALDHFLHHAHRDATALKRGGEVTLLSLDSEECLELEPADGSSPDVEFDRLWALATLDRALTRLRGEFASQGRENLFDLLRPHLPGSEDGLVYAEIAARLDMTVVAVKVTVHRLRRRYGEIVREEIARTLVNPDGVDAEIRHLIAALAG